ncbi:type II secretion system F family protein [bacterium]|nr:type II secretion system F family protein [bacterium]
MLFGVGALLIAGAIFYIVFNTQQAMESSQAEGRFASEWGGDKDAFVLPFYIALTKPLLRGAYLDIATGFWKSESIDQYHKKLVSAGMGKHISGEQFVGAKFWFGLIVALFMILIALFSKEPPPPMFLGGAAILAFFLPNIHLNQTRTSRQVEIRFAMPYVIDLLCLSMEAGLDFLGAVSKVVERAQPSPLVEELSILLKDIQLGKTRAEGLKDMGRRIAMKEMSSFVAVIVSADQMGASIGNALRGQSDSMRNERLARAEKLGAQASQKILIPLVFFILPAVMLMVFGPVILSMLGVK